MTKQEVEAEVKKLNEINPEWLCPLIKTLCNPVCVCYQKASVGKHRGEDNYYTVQNGCGNAMFFNQCTCQ